MAKFFPILIAKSRPAAQSVPIATPPITPLPVPLSLLPPPSIAAPSNAAEVLQHGPQSHWWDGVLDKTQPYGCTSFASEGHNPFHPECEFFHEGIDFGKIGAPPCGKAIYAGRPVHVIALDPPGYGPIGNSAAIALYDGTDTIWLYHMASYAVQLGDILPKGALIGYIGSRGYSTGCHLHFEVRPDGAAYRHSVDPTYWLLG